MNVQTSTLLKLVELIILSCFLFSEILNVKCKVLYGNKFLEVNIIVLCYLDIYCIYEVKNVKYNDVFGLENTRNRNKEI